MGAYWKILRRMPKMLKKRKFIMRKAKIGKKELRRWFK
jgi:hypothetical protein